MEPVGFRFPTRSTEKHRSLLKAARWAASSYNAQPWNFIVATRENPTEFETAARLLSGGQQPVGATSSRANVRRRQARLRPQWPAGPPRSLRSRSSGCNLVTQATTLDLLDLFVHQMAGFHVEKAREVLGLPEGMTRCRYCFGLRGRPRLAGPAVAPAAQRPTGPEVFGFLRFLM